MKKDQLLMLKRLIGKWNTTGKILAYEDQPAVSIGGVDRYEWLLDNRFILHQVDVVMGEKNHCNLEIICPDLVGDYSKVVAVESDGNTAESTIHINDHEIQIRGSQLQFHGIFSHDFNQIKGLWQKMDARNGWIDFMEIQLDKDSIENGNGLH